LRASAVTRTIQLRADRRQPGGVRQLKAADMPLVTRLLSACVEKFELAPHPRRGGAHRLVPRDGVADACVAQVRSSRARASACACATQRIQLEGAHAETSDDELRVRILPVRMRVRARLAIFAVRTGGAAAARDPRDRALAAIVIAIVSVIAILVHCDMHRLRHRRSSSSGRFERGHRHAQLRPPAGDGGRRRAALDSARGVLALPRRAPYEER
jgi:hypothetical protein